MDPASKDRGPSFTIHGDLRRLSKAKQPRAKRTKQYLDFADAPAEQPRKLEDITTMLGSRHGEGLKEAMDLCNE
jgi:hypothetical protein